MASGDLWGLMDELAEEKAAAFEAAKRKFAVYSRAKRSVGDSSGQARQSEASIGGLRGSSSLQEHGELSALLADVDYLLTGILDAANTTQDSEAASDILALAALLSNPIVASRIAASRGTESADVAGRIRSVLRLLSPKKSPLHGELLLALSALAFILSSSSTLAECVINDRAFACIVHALKDVIAGRPEAEHSTNSAEISEAKEDNTPALTTCEAELQRLPSKKCLKRKRKETKAAGGNANFADSSVSIFDEGDDDSKPVSSAPGSHCPRTSSESNDASIFAQIQGLLNHHTMFGICEGQPEVVAADLLYASLLNLLQIEDQGNREEQRSQDPLVLPPNEQQVRVARDTLVSLRNRKLWLMHIGALDVIMQTFSACAAVFTVESSNKETDARRIMPSLHRLHVILQVMEHASFLAGPVQRKLSSHRLLLNKLLIVVRFFGGNFSADTNLRTNLQDRRFNVPVIDVLQAALRLLINLTHRNSTANDHVASLGGMRVLIDAFRRVCDLVDVPSENASISKHFFDLQLLLLSAMANCIEVSEENRQMLSSLTLNPVGAEDSSAVMNAETKPPLSVCEFLTKYFCHKLESYIHVFDINNIQSDTNPNARLSAAEDEDWNPDDIILSGCCALLLGCLMKDSQENVNCILDGLPEKSPRLLLRALAVFTALYSQIGALTPEVASSVLQVEMTLKRVVYDGNWSTSQTDDKCTNNTESKAASSSKAMTPERRLSKSNQTTPSPGRRRNLCSSLSDSDNENAPKCVSSMAVPSLEDMICEATGGSGSTTMRKSPAQSPSRSTRSPRSSFRTPSPRRPKASPRKNTDLANLLTKSSTSQLLLREARGLIDDLDAEFAQSSSQSQTPSSLTDVSKASFTSSVQLNQTPGDANSATVASEAVEMASASAVECEIITHELESSSSPFRPKKVASKRKKDYRLPTSPFYRQGASNMSTPPRKKLQMTPPRRLMQSLQLVEQSVSVADESPARRKPKTAKGSLAPRAASIFDFDE